jgi:tetratricopeptide (TPR) repeat protein
VWAEGGAASHVVAARVFAESVGRQWPAARNGVEQDALAVNCAEPGGPYAVRSGAFCPRANGSAAIIEPGRAGGRATQGKWRSEVKRCGECGDVVQLGLGESSNERTFVGRDCELALLDASMNAPAAAVDVLTFWGPSGTGKTTLLDVFSRRVSQARNREEIYPLAVVNFADSYQSGNPLDIAIELHRQLHPALDWRCLRFELIWACLVRQRGLQPALLGGHATGAIDAGGNLLDLASGWLDAAAHIPFVGAVVTTGKLTAKLADNYAERRRVEALRDWFAHAERLPPSEGNQAGSLQERLFATAPAALEKLIAPALAADLSDWARERSSGANEQRKLVLVMDGYERLVPLGQPRAVATFPYQLVAGLRTEMVPALVVIGSQNPVAWRSADGSVLSEDRELRGLTIGETAKYLDSRHVVDDELTERMQSLTRGSPGLLAALLDLVRDEREAVLWDRLEEVRRELDGLDPTTPEGRGLFMDWYIGRLESQLAAEHAHLFGFVVAAAALRSFDVSLLREVIPAPQEAHAAMVKLSRYSFLQELPRIPLHGDTTPSLRRPFAQRRFRIHELVRLAIQIAETYSFEVTEVHQRAVAHFQAAALESDLTGSRRFMVECVYHRTCLDADAGVEEAEERFRRARDTHDLAMCDYLVEALTDAPILPPVLHARLLVLDGLCRRARSQYAEAIDCLVRAKAELRQQETPTRVAAEVARNLAECFRLCGEPERAYQAWEELSSLGSKAGDVGVQFLAAEGRLRSHIDHDEMYLASRHAKNARQLLQKLGRDGSALFPELTGAPLRIRRAHLDRQLARTYRFTGNYVKALHYATEAMTLYEEQGNTYHMAWASIGVGHTRRGIGEFVAARESALAALRAFQPAGDEGDVNTDPQGVSKATLLLLLILLAEVYTRIGAHSQSPPGAGTAGTAQAQEDAPDAFDRLASHLLAINGTAVVDPYAPIYGNFALAERARYLGRRREAEGLYEDTIELCEKIHGRVEAAYGRLGQADLWRCDPVTSRRADAIAVAHHALQDGLSSGYPWIVFHAALELALLGAPEGVAYWLGKAEDSVKRLTYQTGWHPQRILLAMAKRTTADGSTMPPILLNVP